ncbi:MAG: hypothetical protein K9J74_06335 [Sulfuritalea sp.]|nr:hypothetical protein [Sulfuritalea sp.]
MDQATVELSSEIGACFQQDRGGSISSRERTPMLRMPLPSLHSDTSPSGLLSAEDRLSQHFPGRRFLLVEDELINRKIASMMLTSVNQIIDIAEDGVQAVDLVRRNG